MTAAGGLVAALGVAAYVGGWQLGWVELMVVAAGCLMALLIATPFVIGQTRLEVTRQLDAARAMVGEPVMAVIEIRNPGRSDVHAVRIEESLDDRFVPIEVHRLRPGEKHQKVYPVPTAHRGVRTIGPATISRRDPLHLMRREICHAESERFWVHPRYVPLAPLPVGFAKDLEGPTTDASPAGDVAFHALREYTPGDDYRHIHWMSTARTNRPMVRHYVDNRRPQLLVVVDDRESSLPGGQFEVAMEIAASIAVSSTLHRERLALWTTAGPVVGRTRPGARNDVLDRLAEARPAASGDPTSTALAGIRSEPGISALVLITGGLDAVDLIRLVSEARRRVRVIIVRVWPPGAVRAGAVPGARMIDVADLDTFRKAWERATR